MLLLCLQEGSPTLSSGKKIDHCPSIFYFSETQNSTSLNRQTSSLAQTSAKNNTHLCEYAPAQPLAVAPRQISSAATNCEVRLDQQNPYLCRPHKNTKSDMTLKVSTGLNPDKMAVWKQ